MQSKLTFFKDKLQTKFSKVDRKFISTIENIVANGGGNNLKYIINKVNGEIALGGNFESHGHISVKHWPSAILIKTPEVDSYELDFLITEKLPLIDKYRNQLMGGRLRFTVNNDKMVIEVYGISANENIISNIDQEPVDFIDSLLIRFGLKEKHNITVTLSSSSIY